MNLSVWTWPYRNSYYLKRPWKWFGQLFRNIHAAHLRATKGYCWWDWHDLDSWFISIMPLMLRDMAMYGMAYPGGEPFDTLEKWHSWLHRMADQLTYLQDEDNGNECSKPYFDKLMENPKRCLTGEEDDEQRELREKYFKRSEEVRLAHRKLFVDTMNELVTHWDSLWD